MEPQGTRSAPPEAESPGRGAPHVTAPKPEERGAGTSPASRRTATGSANAGDAWVAETLFGTWFINTNIWVKYVLQRSLDDLIRLAGDRLPQSPRVLDLGCGRGKAAPLLLRSLGAREVVGIDVDEEQIETARNEAMPNRAVRFETAPATSLPIADESMDVVFCHQCLHHFVDQEAALAEIRRILRPGGVLLMSESCRSFIFTRRIRYLFRHPMDVQKTAEEYVDLLRAAGFSVSPESQAASFVWWSRRDMGLFERLGLRPSATRETLLNVAAVRT